MNPEYVLISHVALSRHILQRECLIPCADEPQSPQGTAVCVLLRLRRGQQCRRFRQRRKAALPQGKLCFCRSRFRERSRFRRKRRRSQGWKLLRLPQRHRPFHQRKAGQQRQRKQHARPQHATPFHAHRRPLSPIFTHISVLYHRAAKRQGKTEGVQGGCEGGGLSEKGPSLALPPGKRPAFKGDVSAWLVPPEGRTRLRLTGLWSRRLTEPPRPCSVWGNGLTDSRYRKALTLINRQRSDR